MQLGYTYSLTRQRTYTQQTQSIIEQPTLLTAGNEVQFQLYAGPTISCVSPASSPWPAASCLPGRPQHQMAMHNLAACNHTSVHTHSLTQHSTLKCQQMLSKFGVHNADMYLQSRINHENGGPYLGWHTSHLDKTLPFFHFMTNPRPGVFSSRGRYIVRLNGV